MEAKYKLGFNSEVVVNFSNDIGEYKMVSRGLGAALSAISGGAFQITKSVVGYGLFKPIKYVSINTFGMTGLVFFGVATGVALIVTDPLQVFPWGQFPQRHDPGSNPIDFPTLPF